MVPPAPLHIFIEEGGKTPKSHSIAVLLFFIFFYFFLAVYVFAWV